MDLIQKYNLAIAWNWEYDQNFINLIKEKAISIGISVLEITTGNIDEVFNSLKKRKLVFHYFLDRASDEDDAFQPLVMYLGNASERIRVINPIDLMVHAADKATMHLEFLSHGIEVPYTIIISPFNHKREVELSLSELAKLGRPFIIKPANTTGGGIGVVMGAETLKEVIEARQSHKNDKYLLQETIKPIELAGRRAWFRVFYAFGEIIPCWWDDLTHMYSELTESEERQLSLAKLRTTTLKIHSICNLDFFSTELVCTGDNRCIAVDYVNELCDMRLQSRFPDGVPDAVVLRIIDLMINYISRKTGN
jgi:hypothetical protein